jgi:hypothetical protein
MKNVIGLSAGLVLAAGVYQDLEAATFTPDMWVYEVTLTATALELDRGSASATATVIDRLPVGCRAGASGSEILILCSGVPEEIDLLATLDEPLASLLVRTARIGFNASQVVCEDLLLGLCPADGQNSSGFLSDGSFFYSDVMVDAATGELSYCTSLLFSFVACYDFSPTDGVVVGSPRSGTPFEPFPLGPVRVTTGVGPSGFWDFGNGGTWSASPDSGIVYSAAGQLVAQPQVVPLPAPALMLGSGFVALGALRARRKVRSGWVERST